VIKILLVEDDPDALDLAAYVLRRERFVVLEASDGAQALRRWKADRPDLVILDLGVPSLDGFEVLRRIRDEDQTPVLVLTGRHEAHDIIRTFNLGTDDFMPKPYQFPELIARVRALLRRAKSGPVESAEPKVQIDGLALDPETYEVTWKEACIRLTPTEFRILYLLATNAGHVVPSSRLYTYVWGSEGADANALRSHMSHLRRKLESLGEPFGTISAVPAVGYAFKRSASPVKAQPTLSRPRAAAPVVVSLPTSVMAPPVVAPAVVAPSVIAPAAAEGSVA
jgi:DNA-binding response OmpR family regulator